MAIQNRRGTYADLDKAKMVAGEFAIVQSDDPNVDDGKAVYIAFNTNEVKRLTASKDVKKQIDSSIIMNYDSVSKTLTITIDPSE